MRKLFVIWSVFISCTLLTLSVNIPVEHDIFLTNHFKKMASYKDRVAIIGLYSLHQTHIKLDYFNGEIWENIPLKFYINDNEYDSLRVDDVTRLDIEFDPDGNLWTCGIGGFFKYDGTDWERYFLNDSFSTIREYTRIWFDSSGNTWLTAQFFRKDTIIGGIRYVSGGESQLIKFDGEYYSIIKADAYFAFGSDYGQTTLKDGKVLIHKLSGNKGSLDTMFTIENKNIDFFLIPNPHFITSDMTNDKSPVSIKHLFEDSNGNLWFGLDVFWSEANDPGLICRIKDGKWITFTKDNNYLFSYGASEFFPFDTIFIPCNGILNDNANKIWIYGNAFLNVLDQSYNLVKPDTVEFFNNLVLYAKYIRDDTTKYNYKRFFSDSIFHALNYYFDHAWVYGKKGPFIANGSIKTSRSNMVATEDGSIWISFDGMGVLRYKPNSVGVNEIPDFADQINILPNPVSHSDAWFYLEFTESPLYAIIKIFDVKGSVVYSDELNTHSNENIFLIDLFNVNLASGSYVAGIYFNDKLIFKKIIIK